MTDRTDAAQVMALTPDGAWSHRLIRWSEWTKDRFWTIPLVLILGGILAGVVVAQPGLVGLGDDWHLGGDVRISTADTMLQVMASSMLTFVGVVFAITLVGLQLASSQLSPRVIRTFVRSGVTKTAFGVFLAVFAFAITGLAFDDVTNALAATRTVAVSVAMLAVAVGVFVIYVTATMKLLEVGWVVTTVADEARRAIVHAYPAAEAYRPAVPPTLATEPAIVRLPTRDTRSYKGVLGTVLGLDRRRLTALGAEHDCVIELLPRIGEYVPTGGAVFAIHGAGAPPVKELLACLDLGRTRTLYQDPSFGIRQLVDVATQALSPAVNQATTAVLVIDRLEDLLLRIARLPLPTGYYIDDAGSVRLVEKQASWAYLLDLAFHEISSYGAVSWQVTRRLAAAYADLASDIDDELRAELERLTANLERQVRAHEPAAYDDRAVEPDRLGLG